MLTPVRSELFHFNALHFGKKHISWIIRTLLERCNSQPTFRCPQSLYLCETMNGKEDKLLSNDRSLGLSLVATIHPFADVKGYPEFKPAKVNPALWRLQPPAQRMYNNYHFWIKFYLSRPGWLYSHHASAIGDIWAPGLFLEGEGLLQWLQFLLHVPCPRKLLAANMIQC